MGNYEYNSHSFTDSTSCASSLIGLTLHWRRGAKCPDRPARDQFGGMGQYYHGIPIGINDYISDAQTAGTSRDASTVYAMQFGEGALAGLLAPSGLSVNRVGALESKDATCLRVKWYAGLALFNTLALAKLTGVRPWPRPNRHPTGRAPRTGRPLWLAALVRAPPEAGVVVVASAPVRGLEPLECPRDAPLELVVPQVQVTELGEGTKFSGDGARQVVVGQDEGRQG